jgi:hypothetical protein
MLLKCSPPAAGAALLAVALAAPLAAQERYVVPRLESPIRLDGYSDEPAWERIAPLPVVSSFPTYGTPPSERTEFRLAHDDQYLYASARMYDSEPEGIRAVSLRRNESSFANDWFIVNLDTFRDRETTLLFATSPAGVRTDAAFANDGSPPPNLAWNTFWDAAVARDETGWFAEIRIPLSSLRFEVQGGVVVMGANLVRRIARRNEMITWPGIPHDWGTFSIYKASLMQEIVLRDVRRSNPLYATAYVLGGAGRTNQLDASGGAFVARDEVRREPGLDLKYSPTSNLTVDVTVNPDFAQVEADEQQVNLTRFSLFFPERRLFFQERASVFAYSLGGSDRLFHSRRIGLVDGRPARIYGGARVVGHMAGWDLGVLDMQTAATEYSPAENAGVIRVRRRAFNEHSYLGAIVTSRIGQDGSRNRAWGADALVRVTGEDYLTLNWAQSFDRADHPAGRADRAFARLRWERRGIYGLTYDLEAARVGPHFAPALGFVARTGYERASLQLSHGWRAPQTSSLLRHSASLTGAVHRRLGGTVESAVAGPGWSVATKSGHGVLLNLRGRYEDLERNFRLGPDAEVPPGSYRFAEAAAAYEPASGRSLRVNASAAAGSFYDGSRVSAGISPVWNSSARLHLSGSYQWNHLRFAGRDQRFVAHVARLRALLMFNTRVSATSFIQYSSAGDALAMNLRLRYNPREGNDLHVVYNHGFHTDRFAYDPVRPITDNRTLLLKYSHTFTLGR